MGMKKKANANIAANTKSMNAVGNEKLFAASSEPVINFKKTGKKKFMAASSTIPPITKPSK